MTTCTLAGEPDNNGVVGDCGKRVETFLHTPYNGPVCVEHFVDYIKWTVWMLAEERGKKEASRFVRDIIVATITALDPLGEE